MPRMRSTIADPQTLDHLLSRLARLTPESQRRWGTLKTIPTVTPQISPS